MSYMPYRFTRPDNLALVAKPRLSVAIVISCRDGQDKLNLVLASLAAQSYPAALTSVYVIDDGSAKPLSLPTLKPVKTKLIPYYPLIHTQAVQRSQPQMSADQRSQPPAIEFVRYEPFFDAPVLMSESACSILQVFLYQMEFGHLDSVIHLSALEQSILPQL